MKFKRLSILLTLMLALSTFFSSFAFAETADKPNLVALGDSITYGLNIDGTNENTPPSSKAFPYLIMENGFFNVTNISKSRWTSSDILAQVNNPANEASIQNADVITLAIGSNDLMGAVGLSEIIKNGTPVDPAALQPKVAAAAGQLGQNLQLIFAKIRSLNTEAPIILYNIYNPFGPSEVPFNAFLHTIGEQIATNVNGTVIAPFENLVPGTFIADAKTAFDAKQNQYIIPGDIHPNADGQAVLAGIGTEILLSLLPVDFEIKLAVNPLGDTAGPVTIEVSTTAVEVLSVRWLKGALTANDFYSEDGSELGTVINENKFEVTENGTYTVYVLDAYGVEKVESITIENIKKEATPVQNPVPENTNPTPTPAPTPTPSKATTSTGTGHALPNTASPAYNYLAVGSVVMLAGYVLMKVRRRKEV